MPLYTRTRVNLERLPAGLPGIPFRAEVQIHGAAPIVLSTFAVARLSCFRRAQRGMYRVQGKRGIRYSVGIWRKSRSSAKTMFALMVFSWGRLASAVVPAPAWLTSTEADNPDRRRHRPRTGPNYVAVP